MTRTKLILRTLWHFRAANLAVLAGMLVATAVLTGALMVGDSVRGSLRQLAVERLGRVDYAMMSMRFVPEDLAKRISEAKGFGERFTAAVPGILLRGGVSAESGDAAVGQVQIAGLGQWVKVNPGDCVVNGEVADAVGAKSANARVVVALPSAEDMPGDAIVARRSRTDVTRGLGLEVSSIDRGRDFQSLFSLMGGQRTPRNVWMNLKELQQELDQAHAVNTLLVSGKAHDAAGAAALNEIVRRVATFRDYGLETRPGRDGREVAIDSVTTFMMPGADSAAQATAKAMGIPLRRVSAYLMNEVARVGADQRPAQTIHYAIAAGISSLDDGPIADDEVVLNQWTVDQLKIKSGDRIRLKYYQRQANGDLKEVAAGKELVFRGRILPMSGLGGDKTLTPEYKGFTYTVRNGQRQEVSSFSDWQPPEGMKIDTKLGDEPYWNKYKAAPKLFVSLNTAKALWGNVYGEVTSLRVPADHAEQFKRELLGRLDPAEMGMGFIPIKAQQLAAASGSTDFSMLFVGFSFFLIAAAAMLVAMLFRLNVEQRARQFGLLSAVGFAPGMLRRQAMYEGMALAAVGGVLGSAAAVGYTWLMVAGLRTWWVGAVGTTALRLYVEPMTLAVGFISSLIIAMIAIAWAVWRLGKAQPSALLAGAWEQASVTRQRGKARVTMWIGIGGVAIGVGLLAMGMMNRMPAKDAFMGGGAILLVSSLMLIRGWLRSTRRSASADRLTLESLGFRNAGRHAARSLTAIGLIAFASFTLVTVSAMKEGPPADSYRKDSGTGGYQLILQADVPLSGDLNTANGRNLLAINPSDEPLLRRAHFVNMRSWAGQDISCLNITQPTSPTILAVPAEMAKADRFKFARTIRPAANPWDLLDGEADGAVPVIADDETATYILKLGLGDTVQISDQLGRKQKLRLVGTLAHSIFQSELLMGEGNFRRLFPSQSGFGTVLVEAPAEDLAKLQRVLNTELRDYAATIEPTPQRLARYQEVANTYLSTFQALGSLGLMLGTIGIAVVLLRNLAERKSELALLSAIGFSRDSRLRLVMAENVLLLALGLAVGTVCAIVGVLPTALGAARAINWMQLLVTLGAVGVIGMVSLGLAVVVGARHISPADLRAE